jgi:hypothetical protein
VLNFSAATGFGTLTVYNSTGGVVGTPRSITGAVINLPSNGASFEIT